MTAFVCFTTVAKIEFVFFLGLFSFWGMLFLNHTCMEGERPQQGEKTKTDKEKAEYLAIHFKISTREAYDYLKILDKKTINNIIKNYKWNLQKKKVKQ